MSGLPPERLLWDQEFIRPHGDTSPDIFWTRTYFPRRMSTMARVMMILRRFRS